MHDALLTIRLPLENFYNSLTGEQQRLLRRDEPDSREIGANVAGEHAQMCAEPAAGIADGIMRAIERAARPTEQQRAGVEALRLRSAAMAQLIASSCPTHPLPDHMGRFAAVADRLDIMLFAVMSMSPVLQDFYDSLNEQQRTGLNQALPAGDGTLRSPGPGVGIAPGLGASIPARSASTGRRRVARTGGSEQRTAEVCSNQAPELTDWPIERISEVVEPTDAQRPALDELRAASAKVVEMLRTGCPTYLQITPTGRLAAMGGCKSCLRPCRPCARRLSASPNRSTTSRARFNAIAPADDPDAGGKDQHDLEFCDEKAPGVTDLPSTALLRRSAHAGAAGALDELMDASVKAAEGLRSIARPTNADSHGQVEAMEKRLEATLDAVKTMQPPLAKFYNSLATSRRRAFNSLRSASRMDGTSITNEEGLSLRFAPRPRVAWRDQHLLY
jgi:hypothetical protein